MTAFVRRPWFRFGLLAVGLVVAVVQLRGNLPSAGATWQALRSAAPAWLLVAAALSAVSMAAFAEQQRQLMAEFGVRIPAWFSVCLSYARSAMATALPAGSAVSAAYAFGQYRIRGASRRVASSVVVLSGVASLAGLGALYAAGALAWARPEWRGWLLLGGVVLVTGVALARPRWLGVGAAAVVNWATDLCCLLAAVRSAGLDVPLQHLAAGYLVAQLVRQIPLTPGGIGVIEASLLVALTSAGAAAAPAAAAVLIYRLATCWLVLPVGLACWTALRGDPRQQVINAAATTEATSAQRSATDLAGSLRQ